MRIFFKYLLSTLLLLFLSLYYLFFTISGNKYINGYLSKYLSAKSQNEVTVYEFDFTDYPYVEMAMKINKSSDLTLYGLVDSKNINLHYHLDIYDLASFKKILKHKYSGGLQAKGELVYRDGFHIKGESSKFGGKIYFDYDEKEIVFRLEALSLDKILKEFNYPTLLTSDIFGTITYDVKHKMLVFDNILKKAQLKRNSITDMVFTVSKIDMTKYLYDKSSFIGFYQDDILGGTLTLDSGKEHIILDKIHLQTKSKEINSKVDLKMDGQKFFASIYGTTDNPQFSIDISRILEYQLEKNSKKIKSLFNDSF